MQIFSLIQETVFFALLMASFAVQKLLILIRYHLLIFAFVSFILNDRFLKCCYDYVKEYCAVFFYEFIVSGLSFGL